MRVWYDGTAYELPTATAAQFIAAVDGKADEWGVTTPKLFDIFGSIDVADGCSNSELREYVAKHGSADITDVCICTDGGYIDVMAFTNDER